MGGAGDRSFAGTTARAVAHEPAGPG
jgi:hypothetical protein